MIYRVTCLTPTLVGDGQKLSPIDYMVWKDHVNVLDQRRIFKLLSRGPRLEGYLQQLKRAEKLDFASWGGFAQNFAGRRLPFEDVSAAKAWERAKGPDLFIPTFSSGVHGPYLPATVLKGALRTGTVFERWNEKTLQELSSKVEGRVPRYLAVRAEEAVLGAAGSSKMRRVSIADSSASNYDGMKVYLLRVATMVAKGQGKLELGWKSERGTVEPKRIDESTPTFAEMASPGTVFEGGWHERSPGDRAKMFQAANGYAASILARHKEYAVRLGLDKLAASLALLETQLGDNGSCLLAVGWGTGFLNKVACDTSGDALRSILRQTTIYQRVIQTGLPFPKTRKVIFEKDQPASLPGWVKLELA